MLPQSHHEVRRRVGKGAHAVNSQQTRSSRGAPLPTRPAAGYTRRMTWYRRARIEGGTFFFTVTLADRSSGLLVEHVDLLRLAYGRVHNRLPFETVAICILPDHLHAIWTLPQDDMDFSVRWNLI